MVSHTICKTFTSLAREPLSGVFPPDEGAPEEVTSICSAAQAACDGAKATATRVSFAWKGKPYVAARTNLRLLVDTPDGQPAACRYD